MHGILAGTVDGFHALSGSSPGVTEKWRSKPLLNTLKCEGDGAPQSGILFQVWKCIGYMVLVPYFYRPLGAGWVVYVVNFTWLAFTSMPWGADVGDSQANSLST